MQCMTDWLNPYETLGLTRGADMDEVRAAYHAAALRFHPDRCGDDPYARSQFQRIVEAYHTILRWRFEEAHAPEPGPASPTLSAAQFAGAFGGHWGYVESPLPMGPASRRLQRPTRNEPVLFAGLWVLALLAGAGVEYLMFSTLGNRLAGEDSPILAGLALVAAPLAAYAAVFSAAVYIPLATRKVVYLALRFTLGLRKVLPATVRHDLPRGPKARLG